MSQTLLLLLSCVPSTRALRLDALKSGELLRGQVVGHHRNDETGKLKLFVRVPVEREARRGEVIRYVDAFLNLPRKHPIGSDPTLALGKTLAVRVVKAHPEAARLCVALKPPSPPPGTQAGGVSKRYSRGARNRRVAARDVSYPHRLEGVAVGTLVNATVLSVHKFGAIVDCGTSRASAGGRRAAVDALIPADQLPAGADASSFLIPGRRLTNLRVLRPSPGSGRLLLTAVQVADASSLAALLETRAAARRRTDRRPSLSALAEQVGAQREGVVVSLAPYGVVVNVGARRPGLVHISQLAPKTKSGGFVEDVAAVCEVGDRVLVKILPRSNAQRLALRLVKVFPRDETELAEARALLRGSETLLPQYARAEDAERPGRRATEVAVSVDEDAAWAAYEATASEEGEGEGEGEGKGQGVEEDDSWAWAAASAEEPPAAAEEPVEVDDNDPWAWAVAATASEPEDAAQSAAEALVVAEEEELWAWAAADTDTSWEDDDAPAADEEEKDGPNFDESYFNQKYDIDAY